MDDSRWMFNVNHGATSIDVTTAHKRESVVLIIPKASPIADEAIHDITLSISGEVPEFPDLREAEQYYRRTAKAIVALMLDTMPQGLTDRIFVELADAKATLFRIRDENWIKLFDGIVSTEEVDGEESTDSCTG